MTDENPRAENKLKLRVEELERTVAALIKGMAEAEKELGEPMIKKIIEFIKTIGVIKYVRTRKSESRK